MTQLKEGDLIFNAKGMPVGVVTELNDDQFIVDRRGMLSLPAAEATADGSTGVVVRSIGPFVKVRW